MRTLGPCTRPTPTRPLSARTVKLPCSTVPDTSPLSDSRSMYMLLSTLTAMSAVPLWILTFPWNAPSTSMPPPSTSMSRSNLPGSATSTTTRESKMARCARNGPPTHARIMCTVRASAVGTLSGGASTSSTARPGSTSTATERRRARDTCAAVSSSTNVSSVSPSTDRSTRAWSHADTCGFRGLMRTTQVVGRRTFSVPPGSTGSVHDLACSERRRREKTGWRRHIAVFGSGPRARCCLMSLEASAPQRARQRLRSVDQE
ncbi:unnamed protein product [Chondrus crispus]|uniref:Uncharacterized protein n=1 Tax=Chondrus crispus TaxID=2769 RepID=R7QIX5_CHOCR|nr:unnamed protein product [Chondrus crispus]CDF38009.1 unnamed protein product [Chondrus crispus]|eukprot:XP_005717878.1 unnamed protein product [Chondrus crispus]